MVAQETNDAMGNTIKGSVNNILFRSIITIRQKFEGYLFLQTTKSTVEWGLSRLPLLYFLQERHSWDKTRPPKQILIDFWTYTSSRGMSHIHFINTTVNNIIETQEIRRIALLFVFIGVFAMEVEKYW